jgi:hypothetical protein
MVMINISAPLSSAYAELSLTYSLGSREFCNNRLY